MSYIMITISFLPNLSNHAPAVAPIHFPLIITISGAIIQYFRHFLSPLHPLSLLEQCMLPLLGARMVRTPRIMNFIFIMIAAILGKSVSSRVSFSVPWYNNVWWYVILSPSTLPQRITYTHNTRRYRDPMWLCIFQHNTRIGKWVEDTIILMMIIVSHIPQHNTYI